MCDGGTAASCGAVDDPICAFTLASFLLVRDGMREKFCVCVCVCIGMCNLNSFAHRLYAKINNEAADAEGGAFGGGYMCL